MSRVLRAASAATIIVVVATLLVLAPTGASSRPFAFYQTQGPRAEPIRWNPCASIRYRINTNGLAGHEAVRRLRAAIAEASAATGIGFRYVGRTRFVPDSRNAPVPARVGADVVITWAHPGRGPQRSALLPRKARLVGVGGFASSRTGRGIRVARTGFVVFDAGHVFGMSARKQYVAALHELGHLLGLGHVGDRRQVMYSQVLGNGPRHYAAGDLQGLRRLGLRAGCLAPPPAPHRPQIVRTGHSITIVAPRVVSVSGPVKYELSSPELGGQVARSSAPRFTLSIEKLARTGNAGRGLRLRLVAINRVGSIASKPATYRVPAAVLSRTPALVAAPSRLDLVVPRATLAGTTIDVSDLLRISTKGSFVAYRVQGGTVTEQLYEHVLFFGTRVARYEVSGAVTVRAPGLTTTVDLSGTYVTSAASEIPEPSDDSVT